MVLAGAKVVRFVNGYGCDVRRVNLKRMTMKQVAKEWRERKVAE
jgi:hypothetical protein